ncbi:MAG: Peptidase serine carboxypeptidase [Verrucomicrobiaceae bacterium]|nr:Peptidase serine carboxypeptidase [Verrucomicrobiaceae bacterium]
MTRHLITLAAALALCPLLPAEEAKPAPAAKEEAKKPEEKKPEADKKPETGRAEGTATIDGKKVEYAVMCSEMPILKPDGKPSAQVFYTAYTLKSAPDAATRPVTFCFNGGPGSSSVWVHLGAFGPKKVELPADGLHPPMPPGRLVENPNSLLDATDLVFIDPVNTGFSRAEDPQKVSEFLGVKEDIASVGEFIRMWLTREKRWRSPKFIAGESYGGIRGAGLAEHLASRHRIYLNGLIIVSGLLDYDVLTPDTLNDLPYQVLLPALTAVAHYHKKLPPDLQADRAKAIAEARAFAYGDYAHALLLDAALPKAEHEAVVKKLARLTGLAPKLIEEQKLRIDSGFFREMLLRDQHLVLGAYDGRVIGRDGSEAEQQPEIEPFMNVVGGVAAVAMNSYLREELHYEKDLPYEVLNPQPGWNHGKGNSYTSVNSALSSAMKGNPHLHVLALVGMADLVTPADNMLHSLRHLQIPEELRANIHVAEYEAGHMMYTNQPDHKKMHADITAFIKDCLK